MLQMLKNMLAKARPDPLAALRREPTSDEFWAERGRWQDEDAMDALRDGEHTISGFTNCTFGTRGYSLHMLVDQGFMRCESSPGLPGSGGRYRYILTEAGKRRRELLAG